MRRCLPRRQGRSRRCCINDRSPERLDQHQIAASTHQSCEQDRLSIGRDGQGMPQRIWRKMLERAKQPVAPAHQVNRMEGRGRARLAPWYTIVVPTGMKDACRTQSTRRRGGPAPLSGMTRSGESLYFG